MYPVFFRYILTFLAASVICIFLNSCKNKDDAPRLPEVLELEKSGKITGPVGIGIAGKVSGEWRLYEKMKNNYSSGELAREYSKTGSLIPKIYIYLILWENNWENVAVIEKDIGKFSGKKLLFFPGGCEGSEEPAAGIIEGIKQDLAFARLPLEEKLRRSALLERIVLPEVSIP